MVRYFMPDYRESRRAALDRVGFVLFSAGIALLSYVLEVFGEHQHQTTAVVRPRHPRAHSCRLRVARTADGDAVDRAGAIPGADVSPVRARGFVTRIGFGGMPFLLPLLYHSALASLRAGRTAHDAAGAGGDGTEAHQPSRHALVRSSAGPARNTVLLGLTMMTFTQIRTRRPDRRPSLR
jgi:hypothetical protein